MSRPFVKDSEILDHDACLASPGETSDKRRAGRQRDEGAISGASRAAFGHGGC